MAFEAGDRVELTRRVLNVPRGWIGTVQRAYQNGNYHVRITHKSGCVLLVQPIGLLSVPPDALAPSNCPE